jgi:hypothetical protein
VKEILVFFVIKFLIFINSCILINSPSFHREIEGLLDEGIKDNIESIHSSFMASYFLCLIPKISFYLKDDMFYPVVNERQIKLIFSFRRELILFHYRDSFVNGINLKDIVNENYHIILNEQGELVSFYVFVE